MRLENDEDFFARRVAISEIMADYAIANPPYELLVD